MEAEEKAEEEVRTNYAYVVAGKAAKISTKGEKADMKSVEKEAKKNSE